MRLYVQHHLIYSLLAYAERIKICTKLQHMFLSPVHRKFSDVFPLSRVAWYADRQCMQICKMRIVSTSRDSEYVCFAGTSVQERVLASRNTPHFFFYLACHHHQQQRHCPHSFVAQLLILWLKWLETNEDKCELQLSDEDAMAHAFLVGQDPTGITALALTDKKDNGSHAFRRQARFSSQTW